MAERNVKHDLLTDEYERISKKIKAAPINSRSRLITESEREFLKDASNNLLSLDNITSIGTSSLKSGRYLNMPLCLYIIETFDKSLPHGRLGIFLRTNDVSVGLFANRMTMGACFDNTTKYRGFYYGDYTGDIAERLHKSNLNLTSEQVMDVMTLFKTIYDSLPEKLQPISYTSVQDIHLVGLAGINK